MAPNDTFARPAFGPILASFVVGIASGLAIALPAVRDDLSLLTAGGSSPVGDVVLVGVLSIFVVTMGLFGLFRLSR